MLRSRQGTLDLGTLAAAAQLGDGTAAAILAQAGDAVGTALAAVINMLNPATVVIGGDLAETGEILLAAAREALYRHAHPLVTRDLAIIPSVMSRSAGLVGAARTVIADLMAPDVLAGWIDRASPAGVPDLIARLATGQWPQ